MAEVDYELADVARRYSQGRGLPDEVLDRWRAAVLPHLPSRSVLRVLDLGAGTGIFARAWPSWTSCEVIAVEPAAGMRAQLVDQGLPGSVRVVGASAERLPLAPASVDVVWLSAVIHHFGDLPGCVAEIRRVLTAGGTVLVRGLFADLGQIPGLDLVPGSERAVGGFPSVASIEGAFAAEGLQLRSAEQVQDRGAATVGQAADWIRRIRGADTLLLRFTDDEIAEGLAAMDALDPQRPLGPASLGLLAFGP